MSGYWGNATKLAVHVLALVAVLVFARNASAGGRLEFLIERLKYPPSPGQADDFRVRTAAALALGSTSDDAVVVPLCAALSDPSDAVRAAVAVSLRRLARSSSADCLRDRASLESKVAVLAEIKRAIDAVEAAATPPSKSHVRTDNAHYYVSISRVTNRTSRPTGEVESVVRSAITEALTSSGDYAIAPQGETSDVATRVVSSHRWKGYFLSASVEKFDYSADGLRVRVKLAVFSYPEKDLRGEVPAGATLPGAHPGDTGAENQLMSLVAARAADLFAQNFR